MTTHRRYASAIHMIQSLYAESEQPTDDDEPDPPSRPPAPSLKPRSVVLNLPAEKRQRLAQPDEKQASKHAGPSQSSKADNADEDYPVASEEQFMQERESGCADAGDWPDLEDDGEPSACDFKHTMKDAIRDAFKRSSRSARKLFLPWPVAPVHCKQCDNRDQDIRPACPYNNAIGCSANKELLKWSIESKGDRVPPDDMGLHYLQRIEELAQKHPKVNVACTLVEQQKYAHLQSLLFAAPGLFTPYLLFVVVSRGDLSALQLLNLFFRQVKNGDLCVDDTQTAFYLWAWMPRIIADPLQHAQPKGPPEELVSVLHTCITTGQIDFAIKHLWRPLLETAGEKQAKTILKQHLTMPISKFTKCTPVQYAVKYCTPSLLRLIASTQFEDADLGALAVAEAAKDISTMPALQILANHGANLNTIWPLLRPDSKFSWLLSLILDTFFEQGLRCRSRKCAVRKLTSPDLHSKIISFLWRRMRRTSPDAWSNISDRKGCLDI